jgi:hypothetical protein
MYSKPGKLATKIHKIMFVHIINYYSEELTDICYTIVSIIFRVEVELEEPVA